MGVETGRVVAIEDRYLWLETVSRSSCASCSAQKGCGQGLLNRYGAGRSNILKVRMGDFIAADFSINDQVDIQVSDRALLSAAFVVYLLPLCTMLVGMLLASHVGSTELYSIVGAVTGLFLGLLLVKLHARWVALRPDYMPRAVAVRSLADITPVTFSSPG